jgi:uncharacterized protein (DUF58 family)
MADRRRRVFPLVSKHRMTGVTYGSQRSLRRGQGAEIAGSRPYVPGDRLAWIDWHASARESLAKDEARFIVRQYYDEVAPRVVLVVDRRPSMGLYSADFPWLRKPRVLEEAVTAIVAAAHGARAYVGYLDFSRNPNREGASAHWIAPHRQSARRIVDRLEHEFDAPSDSLELALEYLLTLHRDVPAGSFVFILSDFLGPVSSHVWSRARSRRWDVVPVIVQDRLWEQSFPMISGVLVPFCDPQTGKTGAVRLSEREAQERRRANEDRLTDLVQGFRRLDFDPVILDMIGPDEIDMALIKWATRRRVAGSRSR